MSGKNRPTATKNLGRCKKNIQDTPISIAGKRELSGEEDRGEVKRSLGDKKRKDMAAMTNAGAGPSHTLDNSSGQGENPDGLTLTAVMDRLVREIAGVKSSVNEHLQAMQTSITNDVVEEVSRRLSNEIRETVDAVVDEKLTQVRREICGYTEPQRASGGHKEKK